jgi:uncharacterized repeat protein (TIGR01451 family)
MLPDSWSVLGTPRFSIPFWRSPGFFEPPDEPDVLTPRSSAPTLTLRILLEPGVRLRASDQFTIEIVRLGTSIASATTQGSGAEVIHGSTGTVTVVPGAYYSFAARMVGRTSTDPLDYATRVECVNRNSSGTSVAGGRNLNDAIRLSNGDNVECTIFSRPKSAHLTLSQITFGGTGAFQFRSEKNADILNVPGGYVVQVVREGLLAVGSKNQVAHALVDTEIRAVAQPGWLLVGASCSDTNAITVGNLGGVFGELVGNTLKIPAANILPGSALQCLFVSRFEKGTVSGKVILDTGAASAHDGVQNGSEVGQSGVRVNLTDCVSHTYGETVTDQDGNFGFRKVAAVAGQRLCVQASLPVGFQSVSRHVGNTQARQDGDATRVDFTWQANASYAGLVFGMAPESTVQSTGVQMVLPGAASRHVIRYVAGSSGWVRISSEALSSDQTSPWSHAVYLDPQCAAVAGQPLAATLAIAPTAPVAVVAGQNLCLITEAISSPSAERAQRYRTHIRIRQEWQLPTLIEQRRIRSLEVMQTSAIGVAGLSLLQEQRKLLSCPKSAAESMNNPTPFSDVERVRPGEAIEYRITYSNGSDHPLTQIELYDTVPRHTSYAVAWCLDTPQRGIQHCVLEQHPTAGASEGGVRWRLVDTAGLVRGLQAGDTGAVSMCTHVPQ